MRMYEIYCLAALCLFASGVRAQEESPDYAKGVWIVNEDWYGHENSSVNFLTDEGEWRYNAFRKENEGKQLGCTSQYGAIYGDKFYFISKQEGDAGAEAEGGGRFIVCDAKTLKCLYQTDYISVDASGKSNADGRAFLGVNEHKAYISTSNGVYLYDIDGMKIGDQIKGTGNPEDSGYGSLYRGQVGTMIRRNEYVYAVHQSAGLLVIDAEADTIVRVIQAPIDLKSDGSPVQRGFGSAVLSKDGNLWLSVAANTSGSGATAPYILKIDPTSLDTTRILMPEGIYPPANSWYAWTADGFCSSKQENCLYWNGGANSWFSGQQVFQYDIDKNEFSRILNLEGTAWMLYGAAFRLHPETDELYCFYYHDFQNPSYQLVRLNNKGETLAEYPMIDHYWFPALPVFPDNHPPVVSGQLTELEIDRPVQVYLGDKVSDADNMDAAIVKQVDYISEPEWLDAFVRNDSLLLIPKTNEERQATVRLKFNSNGKIALADVQVYRKEQPSGIDAPVRTETLSLYPNPAHDWLRITAKDGVIKQVHVLNVAGKTMFSGFVGKSETVVDLTGWPQGVYLVRIQTAGTTTTYSIIKR